MSRNTSWKRALQRLDRWELGGGPWTTVLWDRMVALEPQGSKTAWGLQGCRVCDSMGACGWEDPALWLLTRDGLESIVNIEICSTLNHENSKQLAYHVAPLHGFNAVSIVSFEAHNHERKVSAFFLKSRINMLQAEVAARFDAFISFISFFSSVVFGTQSYGQKSTTEKPK